MQLCIPYNCHKKQPFIFPLWILFICFSNRNNPSILFVTISIAVCNGDCQSTEG